MEIEIHRESFAVDRLRSEPDRVAAIARNEHPLRSKVLAVVSCDVFLLGVRVTRANDACAPAVRRAEEHGIAARA